MLFYGTFRQTSSRRDNYIEIEADSKKQAESIFNKYYPDEWSRICHPDEFDPKYYPGGRI